MRRRGCSTQLHEDSGTHAPSAFSTLLTMNIRKLALHWQILIGMVAGTLLGIALNLYGSERQVSLTENLPAGLSVVQIEDSAGRITWTTTTKKGQQQRYVVSAIANDDTALVGQTPVTSHRNLAAMSSTQPELVGLYLDQGQSIASRVGGITKRLGDLFLRMLKMVAVPLIMASLLSGILNLGGGESVGRMFRRTLLYYLSTSTLAIVTGTVGRQFDPTRFGRGRVCRCRRRSRSGPRWATSCSIKSKR